MAGLPLILLPEVLLGGMIAPERDDTRTETRFYTTSWERREAGLRYTLTPWLSRTRLLELGETRVEGAARSTFNLEDLLLPLDQNGHRSAAENRGEPVD